MDWQLVIALGCVAVALLSLARRAVRLVRPPRPANHAQSGAAHSAAGCGTCGGCAVGSQAAIGGGRALASPSDAAVAPSGFVPLSTLRPKAHPASPDEDRSDRRD